MKRNSLTRVVLTCLAVLLFAGMAMGCGLFDDRKKLWDRYEELIGIVNSEIEACTGTCLTREEMLQYVDAYEKVRSERSGDKIQVDDEETRTIPELQLILPAEHEVTARTRYDITTLAKDEEGFYTGLKVEVRPDGDGCKLPEEKMYWKLNGERTYLKDGDPTSYTEWKYTYSTSELTHVYTAYLPPNEDRVASDTTFTATCSAPPETIKPGETIMFSLDLNMQHSGGMLVTASSFMLFGTPEEDGTGIRYGGAKFSAAKEDQPDACSADTIEGVIVGHTVVEHTFEEEGSPGSELAIGFFGCDCLTIWIYEWVE